MILSQIAQKHTVFLKTRCRDGCLVIPPVPDIFVKMGLSFKSCVVEYLLVEDSNRKMVEFDGVTYDTVNKCASALGVAHHTISRWLNGKLKMPEYIKAGNLRYVKSYHYIAKKQKIKKGD